jgi:hypothetical protein
MNNSVRAMSVIASYRDPHAGRVLDENCRNLRRRNPRQTPEVPQIA